MSIIAGVDEAGYGPVLGPMVITIVAFDVPDEKADCSLWELLKEAVSKDRRGGNQRLVVQDSKKLYHVHSGLKPLEDVVLSFLLLKGLKIGSFYQLLDSVSCYNTEVLARYPWYAEKDYPLPLTTSGSAILNYTDLLQYAMNKQGVRFFSARSRVVTVQEFNKQARTLGNKSVVLFNNCAALISSLWNLCSGNVRLIVDKQGGRNRYSDLLKGQLPLADIRVLRESARVSTYAVAGAERQMEISFVEKGEDRCMPVALASIFSKYIRELFMRLENQYWLHFIPGLKPTAGYYKDAQRFLSQIAHVKQREAIHDDILIRVK